MLHRLRLIIRAYLVASLGAGFIISSSTLLSAFVKMILDQNWQEVLAYALMSPLSLVFFGCVTSLVVGTFAFVPALSVIILAEAARIRSALFYVCAGVIAGVACFYFFVSGENRHSFRPPASSEWIMEEVVAGVIVWSVIAVAGLAGGLVYWRLAGMSAGDWREPDSDL